jgi:toxin ParE1/3/4
VHRRVAWSPAAEHDVADISGFIGRDHRTAAIRFSEAVNATLDSLVTMPRTARICDFHRPEFAGLRAKPVTGFSNYLIFYRVGDAGIDVVRVLHGARDLPRLFDPPV